MIVPRSRLVSRTLGLLALLAALLVGWFGWWSLAVAGALAFASALLAPRPFHRTRHRLRNLANRIGRRLQPHSWRPPRRIHGWRR